MMTRTNNHSTAFALDEFFRSFAPSQNPNPWRWVEKDDSWHGQLDLPGFTKDEVVIAIDKERILSVQAEQEELPEEQNHDFPRSEKTYKFELPREIDAEKLAATLENGVLCVTLPKVVPDSKIERRIELN